jgi:uncharacterized membrane protein
MRMVGVGHLLFALGFLLLGAMCLAAHDFILWQEPVPKEFPWREPLALVNGALLLVTGTGLLFARSAKVAALTLTGLLFIVWVLAIQLTRALAHPAVELYWLGVGEDTTLATGGWVIYCALAGRDDASLRLARRVFGLALVPIGLSHFFYTQNAIQLMPGWFPLHVPFTLFTGCAHIAAGLALAFGIVPRLAATLEASMESIITVVCWGSAVVAASFRDHWVSLFISTTLSAAAWAVAASYSHSSWGWTPRRPRRLQPAR